MPKPLPVEASRAEIARLDADARALVDQLRAGSPTALEYADRAHGVLIFPRVETANYFLVGETRALGLLHVKDEAGAYRKHGCYFGERNALGFVTGSETSSRILMFMNEQALEDFIGGDVTASCMVVNAETGEVAGDPDAHVAIMIGNVAGDVSGLSFTGLRIVPVSVAE